MRILFMGTPEFAVPSLRALVDAGYEVIGAVTQPDRPAGRGHKLVPSPLKAAAQQLGLAVYQYGRIRDAAAVDEMRRLKPDVMVTAAYGQILSQRVLDIAPMGVVNVHGSLLPRYRGAAPIQWAVIDGLRETGVTTMLTRRGVDAGPILMQEKMAILLEETAGELSARMAGVGARLLCKTLAALEKGEITPVEQNPEQATQCPMLAKEHGRIPWSDPAEAIANRVRGVNPWPGAYCYYEGMLLKIWKATALPGGGGAPGRVLCADVHKGLILSAGEGSLRVDILQMPGKKPMPAQDFLRGRSIEEGSFFREEPASC